MVINFYNFAKKKNSTKRPMTGVSHTELNGKLKDDTSIINPVVDFDLGIANIPTFNYAYIDKFNRYYFVDDWTYSGGLWTASMSLDVLGSHKSEVLSSFQYVLRSASEFNTYIIDTLYPTTTAVYQDVVEIDGVVDETINYTYLNYFNTKYTDGYIVFGVVGGDSADGVTYYFTSVANFRNVISTLLDYTPSDFGDIATGLAKQLANPLQYIISVKWYPGRPGDINFVQRSIKFGNYTMNVTCNILDDSAANPKVHHLHTSSTIWEESPQHERGQYVNNTATYKVILQPFGTFTINPSDLGTFKSIDLDWFIDYSTGISWLEISLARSPNYNFVIATANARVGIDIPLSQMNVDYLGAGSSILGGVTGAVGSALMGNVGGAIASVASGITGAAQSMNPTVNTSGSVGSMLSYASYQPRFMVEYMLYVDDDPVNKGKPLCTNRTLSELSGYTLCANSRFQSANCLADEIDMIINYLDSGFYIEADGV